MCSVQASIEVSTGTSVVPYTVPCPSQRDACPDLVPQQACPNSCSEPNGFCNTTAAGVVECVCTESWTGADCSEYRCEGDTCSLADAQTGTAATELRGQCDAGECSCDAGFTGVDCRVPEPQCDRDCSSIVRPLSAALWFAAVLAALSTFCCLLNRESPICHPAALVCSSLCHTALALFLKAEAAAGRGLLLQRHGL